MSARYSRGKRRRVVVHRVSGAASARRRGASRSRSSSNPLALVVFILLALVLALVVLQRPETAEEQENTEEHIEREIQKLKQEHSEAEVFNLN